MFLKELILRMLRSRVFQPVWESLLHYSRVFMNFGGGSNLNTSGERIALQFAHNALADRSAVVFDVGANEGEFTGLAFEIFAGRCDVYAFEPSSVAFERLIATAERNDRHENLKTFRLGFGETTGKAKLFTPKRGSKIASVHALQNTFVPFDDSQTEVVELTTIREFCDLYGVTAIDYLKLDIEGHEFFALKGAEELIGLGRVRFIQFEFGRACLYSRVYFKDFWDLLSPTYRLFRILPGSLYPLKSYSTAYESFETVNYLAELKEEFVH